jgi:WD40 repeat protein
MDNQSYVYENNASAYLPTEVFLVISKSLSPKELLITRRVSKHWQQCSDEDYMWRYQVLKKWPTYIKLENITCKQHYRSNYKGLTVGCVNYLDNTIVITFDNNIVYKNIDTNKCRSEITTHTGAINQLILYDKPSINIKFITCSSDGHLKIWNDRFEGKSIFSQKIHNQSVTCIKIFKVKFFFTGSEDRFLKIWELSYNPSNLKAPYELELKNTIETLSPVTCFDITKEFTFSRVFIGLRDHTIKIFEFRIGGVHTLRQTLGGIEGHKSAITTITMSSMIGCLISSSIDKTIKIWKTKQNGDYYCSQTLRCHLGAVTSLLYIPLKHEFFSSSTDGTIMGWKYDSKFGVWNLVSVISCEKDKAISLKFKQLTNEKFDFQQILSIASDRSCREWEVDVKKATLILKKKHNYLT